MAKEKKSEVSAPKQEQQPETPKAVDLVVAVSHNEYTKGVKITVDEQSAKAKLATGLFRKA